MFTGLIEATGCLEDMNDSAGGVTVRISAPFTSSLSHGDSVAVSGVCLTVTGTDETSFTADVMPETLRLTSLGALEIGAILNLERALLPTTRLGGHIVQGHVDGTGTVLSRNKAEKWETLRIQMPAKLAKYVAYKGSVALEGVSLTVSAVGENYFEVSLIPATLAATNLGELTEGATVNLEMDVLAKYAARLVGRD
ncbi:MAG: riboflavin synthase [Actinomycetaceae bacterium]|nr:riboflavin synthase [Actinomycetaceae bacterium]